MLLWLAHYLSHFFSAFRVFEYLSFRAIVTALTSLMIVWLFAPRFIRALHKLKFGQSVREDGPSSHLQKSGTPTMGGALILISIAISLLCWADFSNRFIWVVLFTMLGAGLIGFIDDYLKIRRKNSRGLRGKVKFLLLSIVGMGASAYLYCSAMVPAETQLLIPLFKHLAVNLGLFSLLVNYLMIVGSSNAVNLTDGLDGLALMPTVMVAGGLAVFAYVTGNVHFAHYLVIPYIPGVGEMVLVCSAVVGASLGFLWFNTYPAQVFMGDVGSLGLGALLGLLAIIVRQEIVFLIMGGVFVLETFSVMLQVASFKLTGKRVFRMAPIHHHFELKGWPEPKVIVRFWLITFILVLIGLATLKLR